MTKPKILYNNRSGCVQICNSKINSYKLYKFLFYDPSDQTCDNTPVASTKFLKKFENGIIQRLVIYTDGNQWYYNNFGSVPINTNCASLGSGMFNYKTIIKNS
jgi:hypothetical protein